MSLPINELQTRVNTLRQTLRQRMRQLPLQGQIFDNVGKGRLLGILQGKRIFRSQPVFGPILPQRKMHPGVVDTANVGKGTPRTPKTTDLAVEREKGAFPVSREMSIEM